MSRASLSVRPISELLKERFFVPDYQRGYRWTRRQVRDLLDDIAAFQKASQERKPEEFYCLQPVVVKKRESGDWELVDGQQRLTSIFLIMSALPSQLLAMEKSKFSLSYQTRPDSEAFLENIDPERREENIDYSHMCEVFEAIQEWFVDVDGSRKLAMLQCLLNPDEVGKNVRVIWYELGDGQDPVEVFVRLNMGKIPLTNSELIRALFLRSRNFAQNSVTLKQLQIAQEWDQIEKSMQASDFWGFIYGGTDNYPARIEYLFELITSELDTSWIQDEDDYGTFHAYNRHLESIDGDKEQAWRDVKKYFMTCEEWFRDRTLYHLVGFLIARGMPVNDLKRLGKQRGKSAFQDALRNEIYSRLFDPDDGPADHESRESLRTAIRETLTALSYDGGDAHRDKIRAILLLFNIVTLLLNRKSAMRFPFDSFKSESWDLEHIKSVKSEMPARREDQKAWAQTIFDFWTSQESAGRQGGDASAADQRRKEILERLQGYLSAEPMQLEQATELFVSIYDAVLGHYNESDVTEVDNGLHNLTLLDAGTNRSYKNAVFPVKRDHIRRLDQSGTFAPLCTTNVFLKYYSKDLDRMLFWTEQDRADYFEAIVDMLTDFFMQNGGEAE